MFRSAATKIAHNSTIPALGGNKDLRPLQDLISAEKTVLISLQKLSVDFAKAAEALRVWGSGEGDDLGDTLGASTTLLTLFSSAISQYATHGHPMREHLKSIRTREENLDELKRRRKAVGAKAETAEKKLSKMSSEHKNLQVQTDSLNALRAEIRSMDSEIMSEEAFLGDFKRSTTRAWMGLKFGGLLECCEKGTIAGEFGKLVVGEIPEEQTQPGMARSLYYGRPKTEALVSEAHRCINEVVMSTVSSGPPDGRRSNQQQISQHAPQPSYQLPAGGIPPSGAEWSPHNSHDMTPAGGGPPNYLQHPQGFGTGQFLDQPGSPIGGPGSPTHQRYPSQSQQTPAYPQIESEPMARRSLDDFGVTGPIDQPGPGSGGRFATFPVKNRPPGMVSYSLSDNSPSANTRSENDDSFSSSVAEALRSSQSPPGTIPQVSFGGAAPAYEVAHAPSYAPPTGPPPGAQLAGQHWEPGLHQSGADTISDDDGTLAYMSNAEEDPHDSQHHDTGHGKHVRFGGSNVVDDSVPLHSPHTQYQPQSPQYQEHQPPYQQQQQQGQPQQPYYPEQSQPQQPYYQEQQPQPQQPHYQEPQPLNRSSVDSGRGLGSELPSPPIQTVGSGESSPTSDNRFQNQRRVPPPSADPTEDERALNAAAAREVSREMDSLNFNPPITRNRGDSLTQDSPDRGRALPLPQAGSGYSAVPSLDHTPLVPPSAPFTRRTPSPRPNTDAPPSSGPSPYHSPAQSFSQGPRHSPAQSFSQAPPAQYSQDPSEYEQQPLPPLKARDGQNSPTSSVPPRINTINLSDDPPSRFSPSPYQTPPEYPRGLGVAGSPITKSTTSLNSQVPPGTRTISAAAFKRPPQRMASGDIPLSMSDTSPLSFKKRLPSSPYPQQLRERSPMGRDRSGSQPPSQPPPTQALPPVPTDNGDEDYDYLGAYVDTGPLPEPGNTGPKANDPGNRSQGGYGAGRFATNLEGGNGLR